MVFAVRRARAHVAGDPITPAMVSAGLLAIAGYDPLEDDHEDCIRAVWLAMEAARSVNASAAPGMDAQDRCADREGTE